MKPPPARSLRYAARRLWREARTLPRAARLWAAPPPVEGRPVLGFGYAPPAPSARVHGGQVKLQRLDSAFETDRVRFNVLYVVSSAPPPGVGVLSRVARRRGVRLVWNQDGVAYPGWYGPGFEAVNAPMARRLHGADHVLYQSAFCRRAADRYLGPRTGGCDVLYNSVDTGRFTPSGRPPDLASPVLLLAGSHVRPYRVTAALETLAVVRRTRPGARLLVAGRLGWRPEPEAVAETLDRAGSAGVREAVEVLGRFSQSEAPDVLRRGDVLLHTQYNDACPGIVIEAMACGLPVVHSASGGVPELVGDEAGVGVPAEERWDREIVPGPAELAAALEAVLGRWAGCSAAARQRAVERFDERGWLDRHRSVFERLLGSPETAGDGH